jgi:hypothetical protein
MNNLETNKDNVDDFFNFGAPKEKIKTPSIPTLQPMIETKTPTPLKVTVPKITEVESEGMTYKGEIANHPTRKFYPERTFDQYIKKDARLEEADVELLKGWSSSIANYKRRAKLNSGSDNRITDNTILRIVLSEFCDKLAISLKEASFKEIATEEELRVAISKIMMMKI